VRILIVEDSPEIAEAVSLCIQLRWPEAEMSVAAEGGLAVRMLEDENFDLVMLDINLPDIDGFEVLRRTRTFSDVPVIILTVRGHDDDQVKGLEMGADDYIVKPFKPRDLVARVNAVLRRSQTPTFQVSQPRLKRGRLELDFAAGEASLGDRIIKLTPIEARLLYVLMEHAEDTLSSERLSREIWGHVVEDTEQLSTYINRLLAKLADGPSGPVLDTGSGYRFVSPN